MTTPASPDSGGLDYNFVDSPPEDLHCSICLLVLCEPELTSCCGNHFCHACVKQIQAEHRPCPLCNDPGFSTMLDKYFVRKVNELKVSCTQKDNGCPWIGPLGSLKHHLDLRTGDCKFMIVECPYRCGERLHHCELTQHQLNCPRRPYICKFCDYNGVFEDMSAKHWKECDKYPLPCPNHCGEPDIQRRYMKHHVTAECPLQTIECEYAYAGCQIQALRKDMPQHVGDCVENHLAMVSKKCLHLCQEFPAEYQKGMEERLKDRDAQIQDLTQKLQTHKHEVENLRSRLDTVQEEVEELKNDSVQLKSIVFVPPFQFVMTDFEKYKRNEQQWIGPPFYTHIGGYCMCISVDAIGTDDGYGTHFSVYVNLMKGEYDSHLRWPFRGSVTIELLNQRKNEGNFEETILFTHDTAREVAGKVQMGEIAESGLGISKFFAHTELGYNARKNIEYLRYDCLRFKVSKVEVSSW